MAEAVATTATTQVNVGGRARVRSLDGLRGVGALIVVLHHTLLVIPALSAMYIPAPGAQVTSAPGLSVAWWMYETPLRLVWAGPEAVLVFFVLSGIVLTAPLVSRSRDARGWLGYYLRRLCRLYVPVWASLILAAICCMAVPRQHLTGGGWLMSHPDPTVGQMIRDGFLLLGTSSLNSPLWSLRWEMLFSILLPVMFLVLRLIRVIQWPAAGIALLALASAAGHTPAVQVALRSSTVAGSLEYLSIFAIGMIIAMCPIQVGRLRDRLAAATNPTRTAWLVGALVLAASPTYVGPRPAASVAFVLHLATVVGVTMIVLSALTMVPVITVLESRLLQYAGSRSFSIYLVHEPILVSVAIAAHVSGWWPWLLIAPVAIGVALLVAEGFYRVVERPAIRLSRRLDVAQ